MDEHPLSGFSSELVEQDISSRIGGIERSLSPADVAYLANVRSAARRLARRELDPGDLRGALEALEAVSTIDADVPTLSRHPSVRYVKGGVKQLGGWYLRYLAHQVTALGAATVSMGSAIAVRADALEGVTTALAQRVQSLEARMEAVEAASGARVPPGGPPMAAGDPPMPAGEPGLEAAGDAPTAAGGPT